MPESNFDLSSPCEESSDEEDENDISIDWVETEEEIILDHENIDNIDNNNSIIDEEICEAPEASHQTVESSRKRPANTSRVGQKKSKKAADKYTAIKWQKEPPIGGMKRRIFTGVPGISAAGTTKNLIDIFELMIIDELLDIIVKHTNLYFNKI